MVTRHDYLLEEFLLLRGWRRETCLLAGKKDVAAAKANLLRVLGLPRRQWL